MIVVKHFKFLTTDIFITPIVEIGRNLDIVKMSGLIDCQWQILCIL